MCEAINPKEFLTKTGSFNVSLFDSVFVAIAERILSVGVESAEIDSESFDLLKMTRTLERQLHIAHRMSTV